MAKKSSMEKTKILKSSTFYRLNLGSFTVNKCGYCHKTIVNNIICEQSSPYKKVYSKFFCSEECLRMYQIQKNKDIL